MKSIVTERFKSVHEALKKASRIKSNRQFAISLDYAPQSLDLILKDKRDVTIELVRKLVSRYQVNAEYLFVGEGEMFKQADTEEDERGQGNIIHIPVKAKAGYGDQFNDPVYINDFPRFSLPDPKFKFGEYRCFTVEGDSMHPTLSPNDNVVCSAVEQQYWIGSLRDNNIYVIVVNGDILVKRVVNNISDSRTISLHSDNDFYPVRIIDIEDVREIWRVEVKISQFSSASNGRHDIYDEIKSIKAALGNLCEESKNLNRGVESMARYVRKNNAAIS